MRMSLLAIPVLLAACGSTPRGVEVRTIEVPVLRVEKCLSPPLIPVQPGKLPSPRPENVSRALDLSVAKVLQWEQYGGKADALLRGCAAPDR